MEQAVFGGTPGEIVAADTAAADLSWFSAAQAKITEIFTTAMTNMKQGRTVGTVGLALLIAFAYGALHTLGPGHRKAVVMSLTTFSPGLFVVFLIVHSFVVTMSNKLSLSN
jgi:ABC-type nickel/cobalt efflux system permease component RcnA